MSKQHASTNLTKLHDAARTKGLRIALVAVKGRLVQLALDEGPKRVRSQSMTHPRPLTVEQAAKALLTSVQ